MTKRPVDRDAELAKIKRQCLLPPPLPTLAEIAANSREWEDYAVELELLSEEAHRVFVHKMLPKLEREAREIDENETRDAMKKRGLHYSQWADHAHDLYDSDREEDDDACIYCNDNNDIEHEWLRLLGTTTTACSTCVKFIKANPGSVPPLMKKTARRRR